MNDKLFFDNFLEILKKVKVSDYEYPEMYTHGSYQSWNSGREDIAKIGRYIELARPHNICECGTFEGWGTEFMANVMKKAGMIGTITTIDVPYIVDWNNGDYKPVENTDFYHVIEARKARMSKLATHSNAFVKYVEGLIHEVIPEIVKIQNPDFIYHDATHLADAMAKDILAAEEAGLKKWCVVCFDDVIAGHPFPELFKQKFADRWIGKHLPEGRGQFWMQKMM